MDTRSSSTNTLLKGGYDVETVNPLPTQFKCPLCKKILKDTLQTSRGERACNPCYHNAQSMSGICPIDGEANTQMFKDKHADKEIGELECYCSNKCNGCLWVGMLKLLEDHCKECEYVISMCGKCKEDVILKNFDTHLQQMCIKRGVICSYCQETVIYDDYKLHESICPKKPKQCPLNCGGHIESGQTFRHIIACPKIEANEACVYQLVGCPYDGHGYLDNHLKKNHEEHEYFLLGRVVDLTEENDMLQKRLEEQCKPFEEINRHFAEQVDHANAIESAKDEITALRRKQEATVMDYEERLSVIEKELHDYKKEADKTSYLEQLVIQLQENCEKLEIKMKEFTKAGSNQGDGASNEASRAAIQECTEKIEKIERDYALLSTNLSDLDLRQQLLENTSFDGRLLWKIDNLRQRMQQALTGQVTALHSAPCFTKKCGYKFCARLYLNGDGMGKGTHLSLFFVVMKSEYDALLAWPFQQRVTFRLLNYDNQNESIKETFIPDRNSSSFQKPTRDMNIAAGCPLFVTKAQLECGSFIIDDSIFVETVVGGY